MDNRKYHLQQLLAALRKMKFPNGTDTRNYLDVDEEERSILAILLQSELDKLK